MVASSGRWVQFLLLVCLAALGFPLHHENAAGQVHVLTDHAGIIRRDERDAPSLQEDGQRVWRMPPVNGTIAVLAKAENHTLWQLRFQLVPSLLRGVQFKTPVTFLYEGDRQLVVDAVERLQGHELLQPLNFVDVSEYFKPSKDEVAMLAGPDVRMHGFAMGYRKMCEFWAARVHTLPALAQYHYLWRLDVDSNLTEPVFVNLYQVMRSRDSVYGYLLLQDAYPEACQGLQDATEVFYKAQSQFAPVSGDAESFLHNFEARRCPHWNTNFQLMDLDFFRGSDVYNQYVKYLAENVHGFVKYRWGDHIVQTLSVLMQVPPQRTLCMKPWVPGYVHQEAEANCDASRWQPALLQEESYGSGVPNATVDSSALRLTRLVPIFAAVAGLVCMGAVGSFAWYRESQIDSQCSKG